MCCLEYAMDVERDAHNLLVEMVGAQRPHGTDGGYNQKPFPDE